MITNIAGASTLPYIPDGVILRQTHYAGFISSISGSGSIVTVTVPNNFFVGQSILIAGVTTTTAYNGTVIVASASSTQFTYTAATTGTERP